MTKFNIKNLSAKTANLVGGNQTNVSGPGAQYVHLEDVTREVEILRRQLRQLDLPPEALEDAEQVIAGLNAELASARPDKEKMAKRLQHLINLLRNIGALAAAGQALAVPLDNLARWIGAQFLGYLVRSKGLYDDAGSAPDCNAPTATSTSTSPVICLRGHGSSWIRAGS